MHQYKFIYTASRHIYTLRQKFSIFWEICKNKKMRIWDILWSMVWVVLRTCDKTVAYLFAETKCTDYGSRFSWGAFMYKHLKFVRRHHGVSYPTK